MGSRKRTMIVAIKQPVKRSTMVGFEVQKALVGKPVPGGGTGVANDQDKMLIAREAEPWNLRSPAKCQFFRSMLWGKVAY
jgi:hypothetical protein